MSSNFGIFVLPNSSTTKSGTAPGWAYVPDTGPAAAHSRGPASKRRVGGYAGAGGGGSSDGTGAGARMASDLNARQEAKLLRELAALDKDGGRDASIPVPVVRLREGGAGKGGDGKGASKTMSAVRKILQSQKTFQNHLDDYNAFAALNANASSSTATGSLAGPSLASHLPAASRRASTTTSHASTPAAASPAPTAPSGCASRRSGVATVNSTPVTTPRGGAKRGPKAKRESQPAQDAAKSTPLRRMSTTGGASATKRKGRSDSLVKDTDMDTPMPDASFEALNPDAEDEPSTILAPLALPSISLLRTDTTSIPPADNAPSHHLTTHSTSTTTTTLTPPLPPPPPPPISPSLDPLLRARVPAPPRGAVLRALLAHPPLSHAAARGPWTDDDARCPVRRFCEICGYWGRVRCRACGARVCALECLRSHQADCAAGRYVVG